MDSGTTSETAVAEAKLRTDVRAALNREVQRVEALEAGLGNRRFYRVHLAGSDTPTTAIARVDAPEDPALRPPGVLPEPPLEPIRALLEARGLPVPHCYATGDDWTLLEDVGETSLEMAAASLPNNEVESYYREACGLVPRLQSTPATPGVPNFDRQLNEALFAYKAEQVIEWTLPWARDARAPSAAEADAVRQGFAAIAGISMQAPQRLAHRDFKAANLHVRPPLRPGPDDGARLVMIDLQGAFMAPPEYDLVCLLRDSHVALDEGFVQRTLEALRPELPDAPTPNEFALRFDLLTLTRNGKDLSRYLYAAKSRGDRRYLALVPRAVRTLQTAARSVMGPDRRIDRLAELILSIPETSCEA